MEIEHQANSSFIVVFQIQYSSIIYKRPLWYSQAHQNTEYEEKISKHFVAERHTIPGSDHTSLKARIQRRDQNTL